MDFHILENFVKWSGCFGPSLGNTTVSTNVYVQEAQEVAPSSA